ncbi:MAG: hypothetical protein M0R18_09820 [Deltaproteobacteria bacterium]|nr:hypothetical protein [Deltaproteobacteria bacterium]MDX9761908.1 hypothetical protein [Desulfomonilia bacterium]
MMPLLTGACAAESGIPLRQESCITCRSGLNVLSRDADRIRKEFRADVVIAGSYPVHGDEKS